MRPTIFGILNVTRDSFSDGGRYFSVDAAIAHARELMEQGADAVDVGPASSHPDAEIVSAEEEIRRLRPVLRALRDENIPFSVDSFHSATQAFALEAGARWLNDIQGFPHPAFYPALAAASASLVVMHSVQREGKATRVASSPMTIVDVIREFFASRISALTQAGVARERLILDPGMGFFLGRDPACSVNALQAISTLRAEFNLPIYLSVSRKSFLQAITGRTADASAPATVAAEMFAIAQGASMIRTHAPGPLVDTLLVEQALRGR